MWLVSAAPIELANIIATRLGLSGAIATVSEVENGVYTGRLKNPPMHGEQKALAVSGPALVEVDMIAIGPFPPYAPFNTMGKHAERAAR